MYTHAHTEACTHGPTMFPIKEFGNEEIDVLKPYLACPHMISFIKNLISRN